MTATVINEHYYYMNLCIIVSCWNGIFTAGYWLRPALLSKNLFCFALFYQISSSIKTLKCILLWLVGYHSVKCVMLMIRFIDLSWCHQVSLVEEDLMVLVRS